MDSAGHGPRGESVGATRKTTVRSAQGDVGSRGPTPSPPRVRPMAGAALRLQRRMQPLCVRYRRFANARAAPSRTGLRRAAQQQRSVAPTLRRAVPAMFVRIDASFLFGLNCILCTSRVRLDRVRIGSSAGLTDGGSMTTTPIIDESAPRASVPIEFRRDAGRGRLP